MNNNVTPWYYSWPVIIIAFIVFWPVGLALLICRNTGNKHSVFLGSTDKRKYIIAGVVLIVFAIVSFSNHSGTMGVLYLAGGIALIAYANVLVRKSQRNRMYIVQNHFLCLFRYLKRAGVPTPVPVQKNRIFQAALK